MANKAYVVWEGSQKGIFVPTGSPPHSPCSIAGNLAFLGNV